MFNNLKKKIADGVEGVSAGRQTPLRSFKKGGKNKDSPEVIRLLSNYDISFYNHCHYDLYICLLLVVFIRFHHFNVLCL